MRRAALVGSGVPALAYVAIFAWTTIESRTNTYAILGAFALMVLSIPAVALWSGIGYGVLRAKSSREDARAFASGGLLSMGVAWLLFLAYCSVGGLF